MSPPGVDPALQGALRLALALVFAQAAWHKLRDPEGFRQALAGYALLPHRALRALSLAIPALESAAALGLALPLAAGPLLAATLLAGYSAAIAVNLLRGRRAIDCGCGGPAGRRPIGADLVARNGVLLTACLACVLPPGARALVWLDAVTIGAGAAALSLLHAAVETALSNAALRSDVVRRSDA